MLLLPASLERRSASHSQMLENVHHERAVVVEKYASQTHAQTRGQGKTNPRATECSALYVVACVEAGLHAQGYVRVSPDMLCGASLFTVRNMKDAA